MVSRADSSLGALYQHSATIKVDVVPFQPYQLRCSESMAIGHANGKPISFAPSVLPGSLLQSVEFRLSEKGIGPFL